MLQIYKLILLLQLPHQALFIWSQCFPQQSTPAEERQVTVSCLSLMDDGDLMGGTLLTPHISEQIDGEEKWLHL